jgi:hypothetical protein
MKIFSCWTQNPHGPRTYCKTREEALAWAKQQRRAEACGYVLWQGRDGKKFLPLEVYNIATGNVA